MVSTRARMLKQGSPQDAPRVTDAALRRERVGHKRGLLQQEEQPAAGGAAAGAGSVVAGGAAAEAEAAAAGAGRAVAG